MSKDYWFGLQVANAGKVSAEHPVPSWGARAIFHRDGTVDLLGDRQQACGADRGDRAGLETWVNVEGLPAVRRWAAAGVDPRSRELFVHRSVGYVVKATPRGSHGYMYIGACREVDEDVCRHQDGEAAVAKADCGHPRLERKAYVGLSDTYSFCPDCLTTWGGEEGPAKRALVAAAAAAPIGEGDEP